MKIKEVEIKVHYGMTALGIFFEKIKKISGALFSRKQLAAIIWSGYVGYCEREEIEEQLTWQDVYDYVDNYKMSEEDTQDIVLFTKKFQETQQMKDLVEGLTETKSEIDDLKKKQEQVIGESSDIKQD